MRFQFLAALASTVGLSKDQGPLPEKESDAAAPASEKLAQPLLKASEVAVPEREESSDKPSVEPGVAMPSVNPASDPSAQTNIPSPAEQV